MSMLLRRYHLKKVENETSIDFNTKTLSELKALAKTKGLKGYSTLSREELIEKMEGQDG